MSKYIHQSKMNNGNIKVRIVFKEGRKYKAIKHIGVAHNEDELALLVQLARDEMEDKEQLKFRFVDEKQQRGTIKYKRGYSKFLFDKLEKVYKGFKFEELRDEIFKYIMIARIIEPTSKVDSIRVLERMGVGKVTNSAIHRSLRRVIGLKYRNEISKRCVEYANIKEAALLLYDMTTLYFEIDKEDEYRKTGYSKERRLEPQIMVGLLVDSRGFPLAIHSFEGNKAETKTIVPILREFKIENEIKEITVVADAAMMSVENIKDLEMESFKYIVGSRMTKMPYGIEEYKKLQRELLEDGSIFEEQKEFRGLKARIIYQYKKKREALDLRNIEKQIEKARKQIKDNSKIKRSRFLRIIGGKKEINNKLIEQAKLKAGIKGYVTNLDDDAGMIIKAYHNLFEVENSFKMVKSDLKARPIFHQKRDSIEAHLTICFGALAMSRYVQEKTKISIKKFVQKLEPLKTAVIKIGSKEMTIEPEIDKEILNLINLL